MYFVFDFVFRSILSIICRFFKIDIQRFSIILCQQIVEIYHVTVRNEIRQNETKKKKHIFEEATFWFCILECLCMYLVRKQSIEAYNFECYFGMLDDGGSMVYGILMFIRTKWMRE